MILIKGFPRKIKFYCRETARRSVILCDDSDANPKISDR